MRKVFMKLTDDKVPSSLAGLMFWDSVKRTGLQIHLLPIHYHYKNVVGINSILCTYKVDNESLATLTLPYLTLRSYRERESLDTQTCRGSATM